MSEADRLNAILEAEAPAAFRCLSPLGRQAAFPKGIPFQAGQAKGAKINATIGQMTDGDGNPLPLSSLETVAGGLDAKMAFLYGPIEGHKSVRDLWAARERRLAGNPNTATSTPIAVHGLSHGLSVLAALFADPDTEVIVSDPYWGNYNLIFTMTAGATVRSYPFFNEAQQFNARGLRDALTTVKKKAIVVLNLPGNPTGYTPSPAEAQEIVSALQSCTKPAVVIVDDAYQGFVYEPGRMERSIFWDIADAAEDSELLFPIKVDGATKELLFFPSRVGFITHTATDDAETALLSKIKYLIRGTVGCPPGPSMAMVAHALEDDGLEDAFTDRKAVLQERYDALKDAFAQADPEVIRPLPFNSAFFLLIQLPDGVSPEKVRLRLLDEESVGTVAFENHGALRIAYCSVPTEQLPVMIERIEKVVRSEMASR